MGDYEEIEVMKTFIGKGLMSARITKDYYDKEIEEVGLELYLGQGDVIYLSVPIKDESRGFNTLETAQELAAVLNTFVAEIEAAKAGIDNNNA